MQTQQVEAQRQDLKTKEAALLSEKQSHARIEAEKQSLLIELGRVQKNLADTSQETAATQKELDSMCNAVSLAGQVRPPWKWST